MSRKARRAVALLSATAVISPIGHARSTDSRTDQKARQAVVRVHEPMLRALDR
jgi:hypothetical protein